MNEPKKPAQPPAFDPNNKEDVTSLQERLNEYTLLTQGDKAPQLKLTGKMDRDTKAAWLKFKQEVFADERLTINFMKDKTGLNLSDKAIDKALQDAGKTRENYDPTNPPKAVVALVQKQLGVKQTGKMDDATMDAIVDKKQKSWIDDRINKGALDTLDRQINSLSKAREQEIDMPAPAGEDAQPKGTQPQQAPRKGNRGR